MWILNGMALCCTCSIETVLLIYFWCKLKSSGRLWLDFTIPATLKAHYYGALSGSKLNVQTFSSLNFQKSLFAYNYFLIAALAACLIVCEVYLGITC